LQNDKHFNTIVGTDFFKLSNGKAVPKKKRTTSGIPAYGGNGISWYTDEVLCENDTLVVGRVGFQSGNVHLAKGPLWITDNAMYISTFFVSDYDLVFLCALMEHIDFTQYQDAGDLKKITQKPFMQMEFIFPPIELQREYSAFVEQVDKSKLYGEMEVAA
jgi:type I restriction enzyme S subunit